MISIIIPAYNEHEMTRECLEAIRYHGGDFEIILIDNGSDPKIEGAAIRNETNLGFPVAVNQGIEAAKGEIICLMNNDVIVTPGFIDRILVGLKKYDIVGPMTNYCAGIQIAMLPPYYDREGLDAAALEFSKAREGMNLEVNWVIGFLFAFRKSLYEAVGGFDESLWPCSGEEIDFCFRAREKGFRVGIVQDCYVHHEGSVTFKSLDEDYNAIVKRNNDHLAEKWGKDFWDRQRLPAGDGTGLRLNLGCGPYKLKGFVNIDKSDLVRPDLLADCLNLPYDPGTVDEIYAGHLLEHLPFSDGMKALHYWRSLLREGGKISISVPDIFYLMKEYIKEPSPDNLKEFNDKYVYSEGQESPHRYAYDEGLLFDVMTEAGFKDLKRMKVDHPYFPHAAIWQVGIQGVK